MIKLTTITFAILYPNAGDLDVTQKSAAFSGKEVYARSKFLGDNVAVEHEHMRDCITNIVVKVSFEGTRRLFSATAVLLLSIFLGRFLQ